MLYQYLYFVEFTNEFYSQLILLSPCGKEEVFKYLNFLVFVQENDHLKRFFFGKNIGSKEEVPLPYPITARENVEQCRDVIEINTINDLNQFLDSHNIYLGLIRDLLPKVITIRHPKRRWLENQASISLATCVMIVFTAIALTGLIFSAINKDTVGIIICSLLTPLTVGGTLLFIGFFFSFLRDYKKIKPDYTFHPDEKMFIQLNHLDLKQIVDQPNLNSNPTKEMIKSALIDSLKSDLFNQSVSYNQKKKILDFILYGDSQSDFTLSKKDNLPD